MDFPPYQSVLLTETPAMSSNDLSRFVESLNSTEHPALVKLYEALEGRYDHPFFTTRLADLFRVMQAMSLAVIYYRKTKRTLEEMGDDNDPVIDKMCLELGMANEIEVMNEERTASLARYDQPWKRSAQHSAPSATSLPQQVQEIVSRWKSFKDAGSHIYEPYLRKLAIETNHLESIFLLTEDSTQDLVRRNIADGVVNANPESKIQDTAQIKRIITDTLSAHSVFDQIMAGNKVLNKSMICELHARLMMTCRFTPDGRYIAAGVTRSVTRKTVVVRGRWLIGCCPHSEVDTELDNICQMADYYLRVSDLNPFALASWMHLVLVRCHPFQASLLLAFALGPALNIHVGREWALDENDFLHAADFEGVPADLYPTRTLVFPLISKFQAYDGDYNPLIMSFVRGMEHTAAFVQRALTTS